MMKCGVLFEVRSEFLNIIYTSFGFKGLKSKQCIWETTEWELTDNNGLLFRMKI
jgi:hypothetical protein